MTIIELDMYCICTVPTSLTDPTRFYSFCRSEKIENRKFKPTIFVTCTVVYLSFYLTFPILNGRFFIAFLRRRFTTRFSDSIFVYVICGESVKRSRLNSTSHLFNF